MSTVLRPIGSEPSRVYWRRRLVLLLVLLALVAVVWNALSAGGSAAEPDAGAEAGTGEDGGEEASAAGAPQTCAPADMTLAVTTDARAYPADAEPTFTVAITNTGPTPCTVDASAAGQGLLVMSGSDRIWAAVDCAAEPAADLVLLAADARVERQLPWPRIRSGEGCPEGLPEPRPGTYTASAQFAGVTSATAVFELG